MTLIGAELLREWVETLSDLSARVQHVLDDMDTRREECARLNAALTRLRAPRAQPRKPRVFRPSSAETVRAAPRRSGRPGENRVA
jgi:hypothetical protein